MFPVGAFLFVICPAIGPAIERLGRPPRAPGRPPRDGPYSPLYECRPLNQSEPEYVTITIPNADDQQQRRRPTGPRLLVPRVQVDRV